MVRNTNSTDAFTIQKVDQASPVVQSIALQGQTVGNLNELTFNVTFDEGPSNVSADDFELTKTGSVDGTIQSVTVNDNVATVLVNNVVGDGTLRLDLKANTDITDANGNGNGTNGHVAAFNGGTAYTSDQTKPAKPSAADLTDESDTGLSNSDNITKDDTPTFTGTAEAGAFISIVSDQFGEMATATADGSGNWTATPISGIDEAVHQVTVLASDLAGNTSDASDPITLTIDTTAPALFNVQRTNPTEALTNADTLEVTFTMTEDVTGLDVSDMYGFYGDGNGSSNLDPADLSVDASDADKVKLSTSAAAIRDGDWGVALGLKNTATFSDLAGNEGTAPADGTDIIAFNVDNSAPSKPSAPDLLTASDTGVSDSDDITNDDTPTFTGTAEVGVSIAVNSDQFGQMATATADSSGNWTATPISGIDEGEHIITVVATDGAGNQSAASDPLTITIDRTAPTLTAFSRKTPSNETNNSDTLVFDVTFNEAVGNIEADDFTVTGTTATGVLAGSGDAYTLSLSGGDLADMNGTVGLNLKSGHGITDLAGNALPDDEPTTDETYTLENTAPVLTAFSRKTPSSETTGADTLVFDVSFSEAVTGVEGTDFIVTGSSGVTATLGGLGAAYTLTLTGGDLANFNGPVGIDLKTGHGITDAIGNALPDSEPATDETYTLVNDTTAPTKPGPPDLIAASDTGVSDSDDITTDDTPTLSGTAEVGSSISVNSASSGNIGSATADGSGNWMMTPISGITAGQHVITVTATDAAGNTSIPSDPLTITIDRTAPTLTAFSRKTPSNETTRLDTLLFDITFNEPVGGIEAADVTISGTSATGTLAGSGDAYTLSLSGGDLADLNGMVGLNLKSAHGITDMAGNALPDGEPATDETYTLDNMAPTVLAIERLTPPDQQTGSDQLVFKLTFSEAVFFVVAADYSVTGGSTATVTSIAKQTATTFHATVSGGDLANFNGPVGLDIIASPRATDFAGNALSSSDPATNETFALVNDVTAPTLTSFARKTPTGATTDADTLVYDISFSEAVTGADASDFTITGTTATGVLAGSGAAYTLTLSGGDLSGLNGTVGLNLKSGHGITDGAGNALLDTEPATDETYMVQNDMTAPLLTAFARKTPTDATTDADTLVFDIIFSEPVMHVDATDFTVTNTTATSVLTGSGAAYTLTLSGGDLAELNGTVGLDLKSGHGIVDQVGNSLSDSEPATDETYSILNDVVAPIVTLFTGSSDPVSGAFTVTATFSETVTGFDLSDISVGNGNASGFTATSAAAYSFTITPSSDGMVTVDVAAGAAKDAAGNDSAAAAQLSRTADGTVPSVALTTASSDPVSGAFTVTATFSEDITGFDVSDVSVGNGTASNVSAASATVYTFTVTPASDGKVTVDISAGAAKDGAGNDSSAAGTLSISADLTAPTVTLSSDKTGTVSGAFTVTATFSEAVSGFDVSDVSFSNASASDFVPQSSSVYTMLVTPSADGDVEVGISANKATDNAGNANPAATPLKVAADGTAPSVELTTGSTDPVSGAFSVSVTFSETVTGFDGTDFTVQNGAVSDFSTSSGSAYSILVTPSSDGQVTISVPQNVAQDAAGNGNIESNALSRAFDGTVPTVTLSSDSVGPVSGAFTVTATFSEDVTGFEMADIVLTNATVSDFASLSARNYSVLITPVSDGTVSVSVPASSSQDTAGNGNNASLPLTLTADLTTPTVILSSESTETISGAVTVKAIFSEAVTGLALDDLVLTNATASDLTTVSVSSYTVRITPLSDGDAGIAIKADAVTDSAGNGNAASDTLTRKSDATAPTLILSTSSESVIGPFTLTMTFSEPVTDFDIADIAVENGNLSDFVTGETVFTVLVTPQSVGPVTIRVEDGAAIDVAGNASSGDSLIAVAGAGDAEVSLEITSDMADPSGAGSNFALSNPGSDPISFVASADQPWVDIDPTSGQIDSLSNLVFSVTLNDGVNDLPPGTHVATVTVQVQDGSGATAKPGEASNATQPVILATVPVTVEVEERFGDFELVVRTPTGLANGETISISSDIAALDGLSVPATAGESRTRIGRLMNGLYRVEAILPAGYRLKAASCSGDTDGGSLVDLQSARIHADLDPSESLVCTFETERDEDAIRLATQRAIRGFMTRRADRLIEVAPDLSSRFRERASVDGGEFSANGSALRSAMNFRTSLAGFRNRAQAEDVGDNAGLTKPVLDGWDAWISAEYSRVDDDRIGQGIDAKFFAAQMGIDYRLRDNLIIGGLVQYDWMDEEDQELAQGVGAVAGAKVNGDGFMVGPYLVWKAQDTLTLDMMGLWGSSDNRIDPLGYYEDPFETNRFILRANATGHFAHGPWRLRPQLTWSHFEDKQNAYTDSLGIDIPSQTVSIGRLRAGPEIVWSHATDTGTKLELGGSIKAVWNYDGPGRYSALGTLTQGGERVRADSELIMNMQFGNGMSLRAKLGLDGLGHGNFSARSGRLEIVLPFGGKGRSSGFADIRAFDLVGDLIGCDPSGIAAGLQASMQNACRAR